MKPSKFKRRTWRPFFLAEALVVLAASAVLSSLVGLQIHTKPPLNGRSLGPASATAAPLVTPPVLWSAEPIEPSS